MADPPVGEPQPQPTPDVPSWSAGQIWSSIQDFHVRCFNRHELLNKDKYKWGGGFSVKVGLSNKLEVVNGWSHKTVAGWSYATIIGFDTKINIGFVTNFYRGNKTETTRSRKSEVLWAGLKLAHVTGKKFKFEGKDKHDASMLAKKRLEVKISQDWSALDKLMSAELDREAKSFEEDHNKVDETIKKLESEYTWYSLKGNSEDIAVKVLKENVDRLLEECKQVDMAIQGKLQILSNATAEYVSNASLKVKVKSQAKLMGGNLVSLAGSLIQLG